MVWAFGCSVNIHSFWDAKSFISAIVHRKKFTKATFSWLTNNVAEVAVSIDGEDKNTRQEIGFTAVWLLFISWFTDSELNHKGSLSASFMDNAETAGAEGALKKSEGWTTEQNIDRKFNHTEPLLTGKVALSYNKVNL